MTGDVPDLKAVQPTPVRVHADSRGALWKVLMAAELEPPASFGEIYLVFARPGAVRGNHFHRSTTEWFLVLQGRMRCRLAIPGAPGGVSRLLDAREPAVLKVPAGVAHGFTAEGDEPATLLAYADREYDEASPDTFPFEL